MPARKPRPGAPLKVNARAVEYSFYPTARRAPRVEVERRFFASDPWSVFRLLATKAPATSRDLVVALVQQGEELHAASSLAQASASKPLLLYYSMMQLVKAVCLARGAATITDKFAHGVHLVGGGPQDVDAAVLEVELSVPPRRSIFADFVSLLGGTPAASRIAVPKVFGQVVVGSRIFSALRDDEERFIEVRSVELYKSPTARELWANIVIRAGDVTRFGYSKQSLLSVPDFGTHWWTVADRAAAGTVYYVLEQRTPTPYVHHSVDALQDVVRNTNRFLWQSVTATAPYRKYYVFRSTQFASAVLPQLAAIYAGIFFLGSITRYRPDIYRAALNSRYSAYVSEYVTSQMPQFLYLLASEWGAQDVVKPPIVG